MNSGVLLVFIDGLGLGAADDSNPVVSFMPEMNRITGGLHRKREFPGCTKDVTFALLDACLGVSGLPQSATGQTTLLTGINAAAIAGRHVSAYPTAELKELLRSQSVFACLSRQNRKTAFANAFRASSLEELQQGTYRMTATTVAATGAGVNLRSTGDLKAGNAVPHDITGWSLREQGHDTPVLSPEMAAEFLLRVSCEHEFTLFEHFMTDVAGHGGADSEMVLPILDQFCSFLAARRQPGLLLCITSDHGNIEDGGTDAHTMNPVPLICFGPGHEGAANCNSIADVAPFILRTLAARKGDDRG